MTAYKNNNLVDELAELARVYGTKELLRVIKSGQVTIDMSNPKMMEMLGLPISDDEYCVKIIDSKKYEDIRIDVTALQKLFVDSSENRSEAYVADSLDLTAKEASKFTGIGEGTIRRIAKRVGYPLVLDVGNKMLISREELVKYLAEQKSV